MSHFAAPTVIRNHFSIEMQQARCERGAMKIKRSQNKSCVAGDPMAWKFSHRFRQKVNRRKSRSDGVTSKIKHTGKVLKVGGSVRVTCVCVCVCAAATAEVQQPRAQQFGAGRGASLYIVALPVNEEARQWTSKRWSGSHLQNSRFFHTKADAWHRFNHLWHFTLEARLTSNNKTSLSHSCRSHQSSLYVCV